MVEVIYKNARLIYSKEDGCFYHPLTGGRCVEAKQVLSGWSGGCYGDYKELVDILNLNKNDIWEWISQADDEDTISIEKENEKLNFRYD